MREPSQRANAAHRESFCLPAVPGGLLAPVRCRPLRVLYGLRMPDRHNSRFELLLPSSSRRKLDDLAIEAGLSKADLVRLGLKWLLQNRDVLLKFPPPPPAAGDVGVIQ